MPYCYFLLIFWKQKVSLSIRLNIKSKSPQQFFNKYISSWEKKNETSLSNKLLSFLTASPSDNELIRTSSDGRSKYNTINLNWIYIEKMAGGSKRDL